RNQADGSVEVVAEGNRTMLELLLERLRDGPGFAQIRAVKASWTAPSREFDSFTIRY
ncbi:MAG TPA: acylphosphatase, partial [Dehalococcoidia bacterium]|nr:acylphosphatase [Dehalococcoidia bacterium]